MEEYRVHQGPIDPSILTFQPSHRSREIWTDPHYEGNIRLARYDTVANCEAISDPRVADYLRTAGSFAEAIVDVYWFFLLSTIGEGNCYGVSERLRLKVLGIFLRNQNNSCFTLLILWYSLILLLEKS
nr:serine/threonine-protein phosphatase 7 long form homolog [Ipomoea trifida]